MSFKISSQTLEALNQQIQQLRAENEKLKAEAQTHIPVGFWLAPLEPDEDMWTAGRDPVHLRDTNFYRPLSLPVPNWQKHPDGTVETNTSKGTTATHVFRAMRDSWLERNPTLKSV